MTGAPLRLVFMGCPDFAVPSLQQMASDPAFKVVAVYCMPDRPKGRGKKPAPTPVKSFALEHGFKVETPASFRQNPEAVETLRSYQPDFIVVVAYGLILPEAVLAIPRLAPINLHASILPRYRGPAPIHQALIDGLKETGNTVMLMSKGMDEGDMLAVEKVPINDNDDFSSVHDRLSQMGASLLIRSLKDFSAGGLKSIPQNHTLATYTGKITPQMARINWQQSASQLRNLIRAMSPSPGAWFADGEERIKIFSAAATEGISAEPGTLVEQSLSNGIIVACGQNTGLKLLELQRAGKSRLSATEFLRGCKLKSAILPCENDNKA